VPVAFVTVNAEMPIADMLAHCATELAGYKLPADIIIRDSLPMTPAAKVDRAALRALAQEGAA
jgi:fatty-acyl-CoA synthase